MNRQFATWTEQFDFRQTAAMYVTSRLVPKQIWLTVHPPKHSGEKPSLEMYCCIYRMHNIVSRPSTHAFMNHQMAFLTCRSHCTGKVSSPHEFAGVLTGCHYILK